MGDNPQQQASPSLDLSPVISALNENGVQMQALRQGLEKLLTAVEKQTQQTGAQAGQGGAAPQGGDAVGAAPSLGGGGGPGGQEAGAGRRGGRDSVWAAKMRGAPTGGMMGADWVSRDKKREQAEAMEQAAAGQLRSHQMASREAQATQQRQVKHMWDQAAQSGKDAARSMQHQRDLDAIRHQKNKPIYESTG